MHLVEIFYQVPSESCFTVEEIKLHPLNIPLCLSYLDVTDAKNRKETCTLTSSNITEFKAFIGASMDVIKLQSDTQCVLFYVVKFLSDCNPFFFVNSVH